ncbi:MAG: hypothetical protein PVH07_06775, partial [Chloroflexota bacterium]
MTFDALPFILATGAVATILAYLLTPLAMRLATAVGAIDEPDAGRRIHVRPIPRAGGLAVVAAFVAVGLVALLLQQRYEFIRPFPWRLLDQSELVAVFVGAVLAAAFGF